MSQEIPQATGVERQQQKIKIRTYNTFLFTHICTCILAGSVMDCDKAKLAELSRDHCWPRVLWIPGVCCQLKWTWDWEQARDWLDKMLGGRGAERKHDDHISVLRQRVWIPIPAVTVTNFENLAHYLYQMNISFLLWKTRIPKGLGFLSQFLVTINWNRFWLNETEKERMTGTLGPIGKVNCFTNTSVVWKKHTSENSVVE